MILVTVGGRNSMKPMTYVLLLSYAPYGKFYVAPN